MARSDTTDGFTEEELDTYPALREADVDLVVVMAIRASARIRDLFAAAVGHGARPLLGALHSVSTPDGREADIVMQLGERNRVVILEVENKIDAEFQPSQAIDYVKRASELRKEAHVLDARCVLLAPAAYIEAAKESEHFHATVSYEELRNALRKEGEWGREAALVVEHAIRQHRRGGAPKQVSDHRTRFFRDFALLADVFELPRPPETDRASSASYVWFSKELLTPIKVGGEVPEAWIRLALALIIRAAIEGLGGGVVGGPGRGRAGWWGGGAREGWSAGC
ncbi:MAG: PD-(D/E)XK nuclease family protein [bacterium]|nr:PD-(D/E)XK nuclease family protein [bacterium]